MQESFRKMFRHVATALLLALTVAGTQAAQPYAPTTGTINNLVVFVRFSDQPEFSRPLSYYDNLFNSASTSLKSFYLESSYTALTVNSTFYPASSGNIVSYQDTHPTSYYKAYDAVSNPSGYQGAESTARETALVTNALNAISAQIPAGLNLDGNNDGNIDHIAFEVYSSDLNPLPVLFYSRATYDTSGAIVINGKHVGNYTWVSASQDTQPSYPGSTEIHEMGHSFGYPDLRDNSGRTPVGDWDVMSLSRPVHSGAYMKYRFTHWIPSIPEITSYGTYTINDITQATNNSYKIAIPNSSEFLVLEYRKAAGPFESYLPGSGLCITRVNEAAGIWGNLDGPPYFLYYYRVDGSVSNDGTGNAWVACLNSESGRTQFNDRSNPACFLSDGSACGISIYGVGSTSGSSITFSVGDPSTVTVTRALSGYLSGVSGRVSGATVTLSGDVSSVATTNNLGQYAFSVAEHGNYTITPAKANLTFSPVSKTFANVTTDQSQNFSATNNTNTISGTVTAAGTPLSGVTVYCTGGNYPSPITTDATGTYSFTVYAGSDYQVWPAKSGYFFSPNSKTLANVTTNLIQNFNTISSSSVALVSSTNPSVSGQSVTFTATITGYAPTGSTTFSDWGIAACAAVPVSNGQALCTTNSLAVGSHSIAAAYSGDGSNYASNSAALAQVVAAAASTTTTTTAPTTTTTTAPTTTTSTTTTAAATTTTTTIPTTTTTGPTTSTTVPTTTTTTPLPTTTTVPTTTTTTTTVPTTTTAVPTTTTTTIVPTTTTTTSTTTTTVTSQPLFAVGNAVLISDSATAAVSSSLDVTTGNTKVMVTSGRVSLSAAGIAGGKIYAGETALVSPLGVVSSVALGSASGAGSAGDPLVLANKPANLDLGDVVIPSLMGTVPRIDGGAQQLQQAILAAAPGISLAGTGQIASGALPVVAGGVTAYLQPLGAVTIDTAKPDGTTLNDEGMIQLVKGGVVVSFAPSVPDTRQFATDLDGAVAGAGLKLAASGVILATVGGTKLVLQPGLAVSPGIAPGAAGFEQDAKGYFVYRDSSGSRQTLYPAFLDTKTLNQVLKTNFGSSASVVPDFAGAVSVDIGGVPVFTLNPDYALSGVPAAQKGKSWWADPVSGKFFIVNSDGTAQGFTAK